jgi:hypothetical protein
MKLCNSCKQTKPFSEFNKSVKNKDNYQTTCKMCCSVVNEKYKKTKTGHLVQYLSTIKWRAKTKNIPFDLDLEYLISVTTDKCPVFGFDFFWGRMGKNDRKSRPSLDRIIPELGYIKGNVVFISNWANIIKQDATEKELYAVANWLHAKRKEVLNAFKEQLAPVPEGSYIQGAVGAELGSVSAPWTWEDDDRPHHHCGTIQWEDLNNRPETSSGDGVAHRNKKVEPSPALTGRQSDGEPDAEIIRLDFGSGRLFS